MTFRSASLLAALALLAAPAQAQDSAEAPTPPADEPAPEAESPAAAEPAAAEPAIAEPAAPEPAAAEPAATEPAAAESGDGEPAPAPLPPLAPVPAPAQPTVVASPFSPDQRNGWLSQCRTVFLQRGASLGGGNGQLDACDTQLLEFERSYVPPANGQSGPPPTIMVRVPVARPAPMPPPDDAIDADADE